MRYLNQRHLLLIIVVTGLVVTALYAYGHRVDGDSIQLLRLGHSWIVKGILLPFGSYSSSGTSGNVPGAFLSLAVGLPMKIWHSPWSALALLAALHLTAFFMVISVMRHFVSSVALLALSVVFWLNPWRVSEVFLWNPGYIFFASALHFWTAYQLSRKRSFAFSILHAFSLFVALQIHASFVILIFTTLILLKMRALKVHWAGLIVGIFSGLASLAPYILAGIKDSSIFPQPGSGGKGHLFYGILHVYPLLKGFWYWILFGSPIFQKHIFHQLEYGWIQPQGLQLVFKYFWTTVKYSIGLLGLLASFYVNYKFFIRNKSVFRVWRARFNRQDDWVVFYVVSAFAAAIISVAISPTLPIYWHLLFVWTSSLIPLVLFVDNYCSVSDDVWKVKALIWFCALYFTLFNVFGALGSKKHSISSNFHQTYHTICKEECVWP